MRTTLAVACIRPRTRALLTTAVLVAGLALSLAGCGEASPYMTEPGGATRRTSDFGRVYRVAPSPLHSLAAQPGWERDATFYHIWIKAFADADGDGIGDLRGVVDRLDYLADLGVTGIMLSPFWESMSQSRDPRDNQHGYDITSYYAVNPVFGDRSDLDELLRAAHERGIRVIFDFVMNHSGSAHPWFLASAGDVAGLETAGVEDAAEIVERGTYATWYRWDTDPDPGWTGFDDQVDWHEHPARPERYYGVFWHEMPDLNWEEPAVREAMGRVARYWLNAGFDGFRVDAAPYLVEGGTPESYRDQPRTVELYQQLRSQIVEPYTAAGYAKMMIAENWTSDQQQLVLYGGTSERPAFHLSFDFRLAGLISAAVREGFVFAVHGHMGRFLAAYPDGMWTASFLSNHDNAASRPVTQFGGSGQQAALAAAMQLLTGGVPFIYYGNEIGMPGRAGRDINLRQDMDWQRVDSARETAAAGADGDATVRNLYGWYRALLEARMQVPALRTGSYVPLTSIRGALVFARVATDHAALVAINPSEDPVTIDLREEAISRAVAMGSAPAGGDEHGDEAGPGAAAGTGAGAGETTARILIGDGSALPRLSVGPQQTAVVVFGRPELERIAGVQEIGSYPAEAPARAPTSMYLPGSFTAWEDWGTHAMEPLGDGRFALTATLPGGRVEFKFNPDTGWFGNELGASDLTLDTAAGIQTDVGAGTFDNIALSLAAGRYRFVLDTAGRRFWITPAE